MALVGSWRAEETERVGVFVLARWCALFHECAGIVRYLVIVRVRAIVPVCVCVCVSVVVWLDDACVAIGKYNMCYNC